MDGTNQYSLNEHQFDNFYEAASPHFLSWTIFNLTLDLPFGDSGCERNNFK